MIQFDSYFSNGLKLPVRIRFLPCPKIRDVVISQPNREIPSVFSQWELGCWSCSSFSSKPRGSAFYGQTQRFLMRATRVTRDEGYFLIPSSSIRRLRISKNQGRYLPSLPNSLWGGVWTPKHLLRIFLTGSKHFLERYLEDFGRLGRLGFAFSSPPCIAYHARSAEFLQGWLSQDGPDGAENTLLDSSHVWEWKSFKQHTCQWSLRKISHFLTNQPFLLLPLFLDKSTWNRFFHNWRVIRKSFGDLLLKLQVVAFCRSPSCHRKQDWSFVEGSFKSILRRHKQQRTSREQLDGTIFFGLVLLIEEIWLNDLGCKKACKEWDELATSTGAIILPSTVNSIFNIKSYIFIHWSFACHSQTCCK